MLLKTNQLSVTTDQSKPVLVFAKCEKQKGLDSRFTLEKES